MAEKITISPVEYNNDRLPEAFDGFRILHISDLHNCMFGEAQSELLCRTRDAAPDMIAITGDLIDKRRTDIDAAMDYVSRAVRIAPVYFAAGNHEVLSGVYPALSKRLMSCGVTVLDDRCAVIERGGGRINVGGIVDPVLRPQEEYENTLARLFACPGFKMLLAHKPRLYTYNRYDIDLALCGHAHGGQWRLPLIGGLYAPDQGIFPKYTSGKYEENGTTMVVSRGLGNSAIIMRMFNGPELVAVTLKRTRLSRDQ